MHTPQAMIHLITIAILIAASFAVYEAWLIAKRTKAGEREELNHAELIGWRSAAWIACALLLMAFGVVTWQTVLWSILPCLAAFAITHRFALNKARKIPWWWMGQRFYLRPNGASRYDTMWHLVAWNLNGGHIRNGLFLYRNDLPAKLAYGFEAIVIAATMLLYHLP